MTKQLTPANDYGTFICGEKNINSKLNKDDVFAIRILLQFGMAQRHVADLFNVSQNSISRINTKKTWRWVQ